VTCRRADGQWLGKYVPAEAYRRTIGHPFLGNGVVNALNYLLRDGVFRVVRLETI
jgi:hypothetical protein